MSGFNDFIQTELPKRPFVAEDGTPGQMLVRSNNALAPREMVYVDVPKPTAGVITMQADGALSGHRAVRAGSAGHVAYADNAELGFGSAVLGITRNAAAAGATVDVQFSGLMVEPSWNWVVHQPIFLAQNGVLTQTPPTTGLSLILGVATAPDSIFIAIKQPIITIEG